MKITSRVNKIIESPANECYREYKSTRLRFSNQRECVRCCQTEYLPLEETDNRKFKLHCSTVDQQERELMFCDKRFVLRGKNV